MPDPRRGIAAPVTITVRPLVARIALALEAKLQKRDHYAWWGEFDLFQLLQRLKMEFWELHEAIALNHSPEQIAGEAIDVIACAAFCLDIATPEEDQCQNNDANTNPATP